MNRIVSIFALFFLCANSFATKVPLEAFASKSKFKSTKISPDGKHLAFTYEDKNEVKLGILDAVTKKGIHSISVGDGRQVSEYYWGNNERVIILSSKITGWLDGKKQHPKLSAVNIDGSKKKLLFDFQRSGLTIVSLLREEKNHILVSKRHFADEGTVKLQKLNIVTGKQSFYPSRIITAGSKQSKVVAFITDLDDKPRVAVEYDTVDEDNLRDDKLYLHIQNKNNNWELLKLPMAADFAPNLDIVGFSKDNQIFYFLSNHDLVDMGTQGLFSYNFSTGKIEKIFRHPDVDLGEAILGMHGEVIGVSYEPGYPQKYYLETADKNEVKLHKSLLVSFPNQNVSIGSYTDDKKTTTIKVISDKNPGEFYLLDRKSMKLTFIAKSHPEIDAKLMSAVEPFTINSRDNLKMYGQMTIPYGKELKNLPMVIYPHGGPYGISDAWGWDRRAQMLANNGYLVLQLNFRGSGGYGADFEEKGYTFWGTKMQDDLTDATKWAINQGYADKDRICIHGVSYGGYAAMQGIVREPDLYKCSIPDAGLYEIELQWKKADSFRSNSKRRESYMLQSFGTFEDQALIDSRSPALNLDNVKADIFLVHGTQDVRVPIENAYFLEEKLKEKGLKYQKMYKKDGHGFRKVPHRIELYKAMLKFLKKNIGN